MNLLFLVVITAALPAFFTAPPELQQVRCWVGNSYRRHTERLYRGFCYYGILLGQGSDNTDIISYSARGSSSFRMSAVLLDLEKHNVHKCMRVEYKDSKPEIHCACYTYYCNGIRALEQLYSGDFNVTWVKEIPEATP